VIIKLNKNMIQSDQDLIIIKNIKLKIKDFMDIINRMEDNSTIREKLKTVIFIKIKMEMKMISIVIMEMKKIFSMIFSIIKTSNIHKIIIKKTVNNILIRIKISKEIMKKRGNNICINNNKNNAISTKIEKIILIK